MDIPSKEDALREMYQDIRNLFLWCKSFFKNLFKIMKKREEAKTI